LCCADTEEGQTPLVATAKFGYVRLRRDKYSPRQLKLWLTKLREQPWKSCYVFFKHDEVGVGAQLAGKFRDFAAK
jgi:hypothetical protein